mmetsp:Transcript_24169/g.52594  ORF Transcript_24169/g.52594 Transcript_24169/m.52594 type:complete len:300 (-) Transcript_24169:770-1669(-)
MALEKGNTPLQCLLKYLLLVTLCVLDEALDDESAESVAHHLVQYGRSVRGIPDEFRDQRRPLGLQTARMLSFRSYFQSLLHDMAGALAPPETVHVSSDGANYLALVLEATVLQHVLNHVVAIQVCSQEIDARSKTVQQVLELLGGTVLQKTLDDTTSIHMAGHSHRVGLDSQNDEIYRIWWHLLDASLDDMVAMHAVDAGHDIFLQLLRHVLLGLAGNAFNGLLYYPTSIDVVGQVQDFRPHFVHELLTLIDSANLEKFLDDEVRIHVACQFCCFVLYQHKGLFSLITRRLAQRTLHEA